MTEMRTLNAKMSDLQTKYNDQARLLQSVVSHSKNPAVNTSQTYLNQSGMLLGAEGGPDMTSEEVARDESMRADRIARQMNRSSFMELGENPPKLISEQDPTQTMKSHAGPGQGGVMLNSTFHDKDQSYLTDDSVPSGVYAIID